MNLLSLASDQLRRAADIVERIELLKQELSGVLGSTSAAPKSSKRSHRLSDAGRLAIAAAQRARWAKSKAKSVPKPVANKAGKRTMSAAAKAKIAAAARARWAKAKAAGRRSL